MKDNFIRRFFKRRPKEVHIDERSSKNTVLPRIDEIVVDVAKLGTNEGSESGLANDKKISEIKRVKPASLNYRSGKASRTEYLEPEYNLTEIGVVEDVESFVRQSTNKKVALMFKEGFDFVGKNPKTINYINVRLEQIARASRKSTRALLRDIGSSLVRMSNAFLVKVRDPEASGGRIRTTPEGKVLKPVAAYFTLPAETMRVKLSKTGEVIGWQQEMPSGETKQFNRNDIVHFHIRRKDGFVFGTPDLIPVLDDIRALRKMEEILELVVQKHAFPLFQYIVGTEEQPAGTTEDGRDEVEVAKEAVEYMPAEGCIVTPERHKIEAIGAQGKALKAEGYLAYFKLRVIAGLGISEIDLGQGDTANRGTARQLSRQLIDGVKDIQDIIEEQFGEQVIAELLEESTFKFDSLDSSNIARLQFREIDTENRIEQEKHASEMFKANGLTFPEFRAALGKEPIPVPEDPHDQDPTKYPDWHQLYWKLFGEPELLIRAIDEAWSPQAQAAAEARSLSLTSKELETSKAEQGEKEKQKAEEDRKTKIAVAKSRPKPKAAVRNTITDYITAPSVRNSKQSFGNLEEDIVIHVRQAIETPAFIDHPVLMNAIKTTAMIWTNAFHADLSLSVSNIFVQEFNRVSRDRAHEAIAILAVARNEIYQRCRFYLEKLTGDLITLISKTLLNAIDNYDLSQQKDANMLIGEIRSVFASLRYRIVYITDTEMAKGSSYGKLLGMKYIGVESILFDISSDSCEKCQAYKGATYKIDEIDLENIVPLHPNCKCGLIRS